ncbi:MAG: TIGR04211 family SH3 domain-containing protein [Proteobacteria bacterium]|nr:TIGR04211 family SH3 domain-containing protein [Pseudomonadota bacterium]
MRSTMGILMLGLMLSATVSAADETLYVRAQPSVGLFTTPAADAVIVRQLTPGDPVTVINRQGGFVNVRVDSGVEGWLRETDLTAVVPATRRVGELEAEVNDLRRQLAAAQSTLRTTQNELRQARNVASAASDSESEQIGTLTAERGRLEAELATAQAEAVALQERVTELEMAQSAARLLAERQPATNSLAGNRYSTSELAIAGFAALVLTLLGTWLGTASARRRLRRRYHGLEL